MSRLTCLAFPGRSIPMAVLERLSVAARELPASVRALRAVPGVDQVLVLSTCERTEVYAWWTDEADPAALLRALAGQRGLGPEPLLEHAVGLTGREAVQHLLRVTAGLDSFVRGESDIVGQVRAAVQAARAEGAVGLEVQRLVDAAVNTSRRVHRSTGAGLAAGSVASTAVAAVAGLLPDGLAGRDLLVVGTGQVAVSVVAAAREAGARLTVCGRDPERAAAIAPAGARVLGLDDLPGALLDADAVVFGTSSPERLLRAGDLGPGLSEHRSGRELVVVDLCVPRNVDPDVRGVPGVRLLDLTDLRGAAVPGRRPSAPAPAALELAEQIVAQEVDRFLHWWVDRAAAEPVRRLRADVEACVREEVARATRGLSPDLEPLVAEGIRRAVQHLAHGPTRRLLDAAAAGEDEVVALLAGLFAPSAEEDQAVPAYSPQPIGNTSNAAASATPRR
ncbi:MULTISPECIES: glutamyl-tRNA reductase [unclassified Nocardioides]|uniref:Glutamyl-tRNA reductase 2 n=1 Tax=Nocardioides sp. (strain ATCC BAA-499 / JS614) TaxID=196162 RepID=HEM12_NOCSJ|nr:MULTISPECIES: glutamyl-tRNA reductase [unclassified Nocardioides]A1SI37.1 RecName: Full=Glutamyl-tRNA reductase 2; Short=GluTR 2 [Nocardioides sp. JS614]ABL81472.1 glutamyl-tRNA reductase [Nocardioides sp. JS614]